jgi:periplasmic copper chaperone A
MTRRFIVAGAIVGTVVCAFASAASAHISIDPSSVAKGSTVKLSFEVPNESTTAKTTKVQIVFPGAPDVIPGVSVLAKPGWKFDVVTTKLAKPITTDDGTIEEVVSSITWTADNAAAGIGDGEFGEFTIDADGIPEDADQLVFKAVQTYSDGTIERWVDPVTEGGPEADHPTPILKLTAPAGEATATTPTTAASSGGTTVVSTSTKDNSARALGLVGMVLGAAGLLFGTSALMKKHKA